MKFYKLQIFLFYLIVIGILFYFMLIFDFKFLLILEFQFYNYVLIAINELKFAIDQLRAISDF
jgi:hypothetical protein